MGRLQAWNLQTNRNIDVSLSLSIQCAGIYAALKRTPGKQFPIVILNLKYL